MIRELHQIWFDQLHERSRKASDVFKLPEYANMFEGIVDKYNDTAHFIYELLQNADDAGATEVSIRLEKDKLIFAHNGTVRFTVSDPEKIVDDRDAGILGHINSICYISFSSKAGSEHKVDTQQKIGKFGVGFKSVFQYTTTPEVYDDPFCFRIDDYIVPSLIDNPQYQKKGHTVFVIPFNRNEISKAQAFEEIVQKLRDLRFPQLFLNHLQSISWQTPTESNRIVKTLDVEGKSHNINYKLYSLSSSVDNEKKKFLLLSRSVDIPNEGAHNIAIGYYIDKGRILTIDSHNIHCFFPTNENIETCYVIHAPFALVDNRQQIKRNNKINHSLFESIAKLAADSLLVLRDWKGYDRAKLLNDNITKLVSHNVKSFNEGSYYISNPIRAYFKESYKNILDNEAVYLSREGKYLKKDEAWWADNEIRELLTRSQLERLVLLHCNRIKTCDFVLCSLNLSNLLGTGIYIDRFNGEEFAKRITSAFMKEQSYEWLSRFYKFITDKRLIEIYRINSKCESSAPMRYANIIKVQSGEFVSAYNEANEAQVFTDQDGTCAANRCVNIPLIECCGPFRELLDKLNIKTPNQLDKLRLRIDEHENLNQRDNNDLLVSIIRYYGSCSDGNSNEIIQLVNEKLSLRAKELNSEEYLWAKAEQVYDDNSMLMDYYSISGLRDKYFIDRSYYASTIECVGKIAFDDFISKLKIITKPPYTLKSVALSGRELGLREHRTYEEKTVSMVDGLEVVLANGTKDCFSESLSHFIWNLIIDYSKQYNKFFENDISSYSWHKKRYIKDWGKSSMIDIIRNSKWLFIKDECKSLEDGIYKEELEENGYHCDDLIITGLKIKSAPNVVEAEIIQGMSEETRTAFALGQALMNAKINSVEEFRSKMKDMAEYEKQKETDANLQTKRQARAERRRQETLAFNEFHYRKKSSGIKATDFDAPDNERARSPKTQSSTSGKSLDEILEGFAEKAQIEREEFELVANLRERITQSEKYSYDWLTSLMQLEVKSQGGDGAAGKKALYISFKDISANPKNDRMIVLSGASRSVPMSLEEMDDIPVTFVFKNGAQDTIKFESISVKEDSVILIHKADVIDTIRKNINSISYVFTEIIKPIELLGEWQRCINALRFEPDDSIKSNLRRDIEFIFGPPGTGKTTTLARRIRDIISGEEREMKILVFAPTNKACDVLTRKLLESRSGDDPWIWRFEKTDDLYLEEQGVVYKRTSKVSDQRKVCVISTIARYAFDGFEDGYLRDHHWDYVFIDEASMIPLYQIVPPLYNPMLKKIIVSGDPFQIEPIVNIDLWKGENIYTMINLNDFANPTTEPVQFKITTLMTQYRSIPKIGELFSSYLYGGKLLHNRTENHHRKLEMGIRESPLNIISFPVGKESIFDLKRLSGSNIQIYSVIFTVEFLKHITRNLNNNHKDDAESIKIGVISPYSAEIQAIEKIYTQSCLPYDNIDVVFGSTHGFQGDQCDIVIAVMNPPASGLKRTADMTFINNKNILNVAISRASDYLFVLIPEKDYENFNSLYEIKKIGRKMNELGSEIYSNDIVEKILFSESMHIEHITYVTSHKMTNVFNDPFTPYEIRIDENAIDIQINDL